MLSNVKTLLSRLKNAVEDVLWLNILSVLVLSIAMVWGAVALIVNHEAPLTYQMLMAVASVTVAVLGLER